MCVVVGNLFCCYYFLSDLGPLCCLSFWFFDFQSSVGACDVHWQRENCVRNLSTTSVDASSHPQCQFSVSSQGGDARAIGSVTVWRTHLSKYVYQGRETWREATVQQCWCRSGPSGWRPQANCWSTICDTLHRTLHSLFTKCISTFCLGSLCKNINIIT